LGSICSHLKSRFDQHVGLAAADADEKRYLQVNPDGQDDIAYRKQRLAEYGYL
jgi:hypothetical protein